MCPPAATRSLMLGPRAPNAAPALGDGAGPQAAFSLHGHDAQQLLQGVKEAVLPLATGSEGL